MLQTIIAFHSSPYGNEWNYKYIPFLLNNFFCWRFSFVKLNIASFRLKTKLKRACYCSKNPTAQRCGNTALGVSSYRSFLTGYYLLVLMVWIICIFGRNEKCYLILLRKRIRFSMLFYSIMQFSLFLQPAIPLLINLISVYNKLLDSLL